MKSSFTTESDPFTALETLEPEDAFEFEEEQLSEGPSGSSGSQTPTGPFGVLTVSGQPSFRYAFTAEDALWLARFVIGEAGGRDNAGSRAVIWAMFNRYALFTHRVYPTFSRFIRAYSTPLQAVLNSGGAAARHYKNPDFVRTRGTYTGKYSHVPRGQLRRFLKLQATPWSSLPASARGLAERAIRGQLPNTIGNASEFEDTAVYFRQAYGRLPTMDEWRAYNAKVGRLKKRTWIGDVPGLTQYHKNAFFVDNRVANLPQRTVVIAGVRPQIVPALASPEQDNPSGPFTALETLEPEDAFEFEEEELPGESLEAGDTELPAPDSQLEWTEEELQYSIIVSPTSPGDDRFRITARSKRPSTLMFPFNTICLLERNPIGGGAVSRVTGTLIAPQVVLTAKHCLTRLNVRTAAEGPRFTSIRVSPGADLSAARNQRPAAPASITAAAARFRVHPTLDFGVIILPTAFRRPTQFMRLQPRSDVNTATLLTIAGYPSDKPPGTMWGHSERIQLTGISATHLNYVIDTCPGHSGSPIWLLGNNAIRLLLGIHTEGASGTPSGRCQSTGGVISPVPGTNRGVRITCEVIDQITAWCREFKVTPPTPDPTYRQRCTR